MSVVSHKQESACKGEQNQIHWVVGKPWHFGDTEGSNSRIHAAWLPQCKVYALYVFLSQCKVWTLYLEALKKKCFEWQCAPSFVLLLRPEDHKSLIQNTEEIKRTLFNETKQDKTCTFLRKSSFSSYVQQKNRKTDNGFNLSCVSWNGGGWQKERGTRLTDHKSFICRCHCHQLIPMLS